MYRKFLQCHNPGSSVLYVLYRQTQKGLSMQVYDVNIEFIDRFIIFYYFNSRDTQPRCC